MLYTIAANNNIRYIILYKAIILYDKKYKRKEQDYGI